MTTSSHVRTPKRAGGLSDRQLANLAREYRLVKAQAKVEAEHAKELADDILAELEVRGGSVVDADGMTIIRRSRVSRKVNMDKLRKRVPLATFRRLTTLVLNTSLWNDAVNRGLVTEQVVADVEEETQSAAWIEVSEVLA